MKARGIFLAISCLPCFQVEPRHIAMPTGYLVIFRHIEFGSIFPGMVLHSRAIVM